MTGIFLIDLLFPHPPLLLGYLLTLLPLCLSLGPDTTLLLNQTISYGRRAGMGVVFGVAAGITVHITLVSLGASLFISENPMVIIGIGIVGSGYLFYLGYNVLRQGLSVRVGEVKNVRQFGKAAFMAFFTNVTNPKVLLVFLAIMPNFVRGENILMQFLGLGIASLFLNTPIQVGLVFLAEKSVKFLGNEKLLKRVNYGFGVVFFLLGVSLLFQSISLTL